MKKVCILFLTVFLNAFGFSPICCCSGMIASDISNFEKNVDINIKKETLFIEQLDKIIQKEPLLIKQRTGTKWNTGLYGIKNIEDIALDYQLLKSDSYAKKNVFLKELNEKMEYLINKALILKAKEGVGYGL